MRISPGKQYQGNEPQHHPYRIPIQGPHIGHENGRTHMAEGLYQRPLANHRAHGTQPVEPGGQLFPGSPGRQEEGRMANHKFLFPGTGPHGLLQEVAQLLLNGRHRHPGRMAAAADKYPGHKSEDSQHQKGVEIQRPLQEPFQSGHRLTPVFPFVPEPVVLHEQKEHQAHRQHKGGLDPPVDIHFQKEPGIAEHPAKKAGANQG